MSHKRERWESLRGGNGAYFSSYNQLPVRTTKGHESYVHPLPHQQGHEILSYTNVHPSHTHARTYAQRHTHTLEKEQNLLVIWSLFECKSPFLRSGLSEWFTFWSREREQGAGSSPGAPGSIAKCACLHLHIYVLDIHLVPQAEISVNSLGDSLVRWLEDVRGAGCRA